MSNKSNKSKYIYEFNLCDWDTYSPYWFECECSKEEFEETCSLLIDAAVEKIYKKDRRIGGEIIVDLVVKKLKEKYKEIHSDHEISMGLSFPCEVKIGKNDWEKWPDVISEKSKKTNC